MLSHNAEAAGTFDPPDEIALFVWGQGKLHGSTGDVPGNVLATDQIVADMVVDRIRFQESPVRHDEPFPCLEAVVGRNTARSCLEIR
jgi:hypothetical protein